MLVRNPDLLICWKKRRLLIRELESGKTILSSPELVALLDLFDRPRNPRDVAASYEGYETKSVLRGIARLQTLGLLLPEEKARRKTSRIDAWKDNLASTHYHIASRDIRYLKSRGPIDLYLRTRVTSKRRPAKFKRYPSAVGRRLAGGSFAPGDEAGFLSVLRARRTVREFTDQPVAFEDLAELVRGTWGFTGWLDGGILGQLLTKTSPSAGALHPIECYVLAWNVRNLPAGLYHYDVSSDELRRLRSGDMRAAAVRAASGQKWVGQAAFLCVMTAVFKRTLWKYHLESAYRVVWLDAGHLAQTFCLLATFLGLGPFTTAAIQDTYLERLIGIDGVKEFPVYLCGAGVPARRLIRT